MSKSRARKPEVIKEENSGTELAAKEAPKKYTEIKIKGVKEKIPLTGSKHRGGATHYFFVHPDNGKEARVIVLDK